MRMRMAMMAGLVVMAGGVVFGQAAGAGGDAPAGAVEVLKGLEARKGTLKDFSAKVENSTEHLAGDVESKTGEAVYVNEGGTPKFSAHFTQATSDGKPAPTPDETVVFDGTKVTLVDKKAKTFRQQSFTAPGGGPGDVTSLDGPLPLPIGLKADEVVKNFVVTEGKGEDADHAVIKLKPRDKAKYDYKSIELTVDKKLDLPVKVVVEQKGSDITTIKLTEVKVNGGGVKVETPAAPTGEGWTVETK